MKTVDNILREMRRLADEAEMGDCYDLRGLSTDSLRAFADRIEAAEKREREAGAEAAQICGEIGEIIGRKATREKSSAVGNASANHQFREVAKMIPHEEVAVSKMETTTPTSEKSSQVGNAAKMREAITKCVDMITEFSNANIVTTPLDVIIDIDGILKYALSVPPRKCDVLSDAQEALQAIHEDRCYVNNPIDERRLTVEWLFAESKGATDGSK